MAQIVLDTWYERVEGRVGVMPVFYLVYPTAGAWSALRLTHTQPVHRDILLCDTYVQQRNTVFSVVVRCGT